MENIFIEVEKKIKKKVEIQVPSYYKSGGCFWYKIISKEKCISICCDEYVEKEIGVRDVSLVFHGRFIACSEEEFLQKKSEVIEYLKTI